MAYWWDAAEPQLLSVCSSLFAETRVAEGPAQLFAAGFALRVERRTVAVGGLFRSGLYVDALNLVRAAFEDWITLSYYLLRKSPDEFLDDMQFDARRNRARFFTAISTLTNDSVAAAEVGELPQLCFDEAKLRQRLPDLAARSRSVGLEDVYRYVYPFLSMMSHGDIEALYWALPHVDGAWTPQAPERTQNDENRWAMWVWWFHLRTLTQASRAMRGADLEPLSDQVLAMFDDVDAPAGMALAAVLQRER